MNLFYQLGLALYYFIISIVALFNPKAKQFVDGRKNWKSKLPKIKNNEEWVWFQASSQGEFEDGVALINTIKKERPELKILLTFFSPSGFENKKNHAFADHTMYLPLDYKSNAKHFLKHFSFKAIFFVRHDIWKNYLSVAHKMGIPSYLIFCTLTKSSSTLRFPAKNTFKKSFQLFTHVFCHDENSRNILKSIFGVKNSSVAGSTRVENIANKELRDTSIVDEFIGKSKSVVVGSSAMSDEKMLIPVIEKFKNEDIKWIVVSHEVDRDFSHFKDYQLYTEINTDSDKKVLIVNTIGLLFSLYKNTDLAIIGGGFSKMGIHNTIEAAIFGTPVLFGPNHRDYPEALALLKEKQAFIYHNEIELEKLIREQLYSIEKMQESEYINSNRSTSRKILKQLETEFAF